LQRTARNPETKTPNRARLGVGSRWWRPPAETTPIWAEPSSMPVIPRVTVPVLMTIAAAEPVVPLVAKPLCVTPGALAFPRMVVVVAAPVRVVIEHLARPDKHRRPHVHRYLLNPGRAALEANRKVDIGARLGNGGGAEGRGGESDDYEELGGGEEVHDGGWSCEEVILRGPP
jgi:hypothetical protein